MGKTREEFAGESAVRSLLKVFTFEEIIAALEAAR